MMELIERLVYGWNAEVVRKSLRDRCKIAASLLSGGCK
jgi:hypothetical protein